MLTVGRIFRFEAAHKLPDHKGKCKKLHGHSYKLEIEVGSINGKVNEESGMVIDFGKLKEIIQNDLLYRFDHSYLNDYFFDPTAEIILFEIVEMVKEILLCKAEKVKLIRAKLWETEKCYAQWEAENESI